MTIEEKTLKLAEHFKLPKTTVCPVCHGKTPMYDGDDYGITLWRECEHCDNTGKVPEYYPYLPNYFFDLNVMHGAEKLLTFHQETEYVANLMRQHKEYSMTKGFMATAAQRAEAFGKALNLW
jgi:hypothetical protein